jgi:hypothetical protein
MVDGGGQVGGGIDERAVEVEADDAEGEIHLSISFSRSCLDFARHERI